MDRLIYLAQPYTGTDEEMEDRYEIACEITAKLKREGHYVFSPIAHSHGPAQFGLPKDFAYWKGYCELMIPKCDEIRVMTISGWTTSVGVAAEIELADKLGIPVITFDPYENNE